MLLILYLFAMLIWPFRRTKNSEPEDANTASTEDVAAAPAIDYQDWGIRLGALGKFEQAAERFEQAAKISPDDPAANYNLALAYDLAGDHSRAMSSYQRTVEQCPDFPDTYINIAAIYINLGDITNAIESLRRASEINPTDPVSHFDIACIYLAERRVEESIEEFNKAAQLDPKDARTRFNLAIALFRSGKVEEARNELSDFLALEQGMYPKQREYAVSFIDSEHNEQGDLHVI